MDIKIRDRDGNYQTYNGIDKLQVTKTDNTIGTFNDVSDTTANASDVEQGKYFYNSQGQRVAGTKVTYDEFKVCNVTQTIDGDYCRLDIVDYNGQENNNYLCGVVKKGDKQQLYIIDKIGE